MPEQRVNTRVEVLLSTCGRLLLCFFFRDKITFYGLGLFFWLSFRVVFGWLLAWVFVLFVCLLVFGVVRVLFPSILILQLLP